MGEIQTCTWPLLHTLGSLPFLNFLTWHHILSFNLAQGSTVQIYTAFKPFQYHSTYSENSI